MLDTACITGKLYGGIGDRVRMPGLAIWTLWNPCLTWMQIRGTKTNVATLELTVEPTLELTVELTLERLLTVRQLLPLTTVLLLPALTTVATPLGIQRQILQGIPALVIHILLLG